MEDERGDLEPGLNPRGDLEPSKCSKLRGKERKGEMKSKTKKKPLRKHLALLLACFMIFSAFGSSFAFAGQRENAKTVTVNFSLFGDEVHGDIEASHSMAEGNLPAWILEKQITVAEGATVKDVLETAVQSTGYEIVYKEGTSYVSGIRLPSGDVLSEFSNGEKSGWMYAVDGKYPDVYCDKRVVSDGEQIIWHYTDNYEKEKEPVKIPENPVTPKFNPFDYVTAASIFEAVKGENKSADQITDSLKGVVENGEKFFAYVNPETKEVTFRSNSYYPSPKANVQIEWVSSSAPEYIPVNTGKEERRLRLMKRPVAADNEPAKQVVLTYKLTGKNDFSDLAEKTETLTLTVVPGEKIMGSFDYVKAGIFDSMKGKNKSASSITSDLVFPVAKHPAYIAVSDAGALTWKSASYYPHDVKVTFDKSSRPDILSVPASGDSAPSGIKLISKPAEDTDVLISMTLEDRYDPSVKENFDLKLTVKGDKSASVNVLDAITPKLLFDAIKGENKAQDAVTKDFVLPANESNPFYAKVRDDGSFDKWWANPRDSQVEVKITETDHPELVKVATDTLKITKFPTKDTTVNLTFKLKDLKNSENEKTVKLPVVLKSSESKVLNAITPQLLFDAIKGENADKGEISKQLSLPKDANESNPFYARVHEDGSFDRWWGSERTSQVKVELKDTDHPELIKVGTDTLEIIKFPEERTDVKLNFVASETANPEAKKNVTVTITLRSQGEIDAEKNTAAELEGYLNKYLKPEYISYSQMKKPGVSFADDYAKDNVRYTFNLPNIVSLENLPWKEVKANVTADKAQDMNVKYKYTCEPVRADVGGKTKEVTLTYTLTKNGISVSRDFVVKIPALTEAEIDEELSLLKEAKENLFDGLKGSNFDADNVTDSLKDTLYEVRYGENGELEWAENSRETLYCGLHFPSNEGWDVQYVSGDKGLFDSVNMVLKNRPKEDTRVVATHSIESMQLQRYAELYKDNEKLQKLKKQDVSIEFTVRKVNADMEKLTVAGKDIKTSIGEGEKSYSVLTEKTLEEADIKAVPVNKGASVLIAGTDVTGKFTSKLALENGFCRFTVSVSDEDSKNAGTKVTNNIQVTVASREYLENEIAKLPDDSKDATRADVEKASELWNQYHGLDKADKASIKGHEKLEAYEGVIADPLSVSRKDVEKTAAKLFDGIKGANIDPENVYTDFEEVSYAKIGSDNITWSKDAKGSDVRIDWISSSAPEYVNVHNGNDFETGYVEAFKISKRPQGKSLPVTFKAKLTHLRDSQVTKDVEISFVLREYTGNLKALSIDEIEKFALVEGQSDYVIEKPEILESVTLRFAPEIPNAEVTVNGQKAKDGVSKVDVKGDETTVKIVVNDGVKNTLNDKWAEKEYTLVFKNEEGKPDPGPQPGPDPEKPEPPVPAPDPDPEKPEPPVPAPDPDPEKPEPPVPAPDPDPEKPEPPVPAPDPNPEKPVTPSGGDTDVPGSQGENAGGNGNQGQNPPVGQNSQDGAVQTGDTSDMNLPVLLVSVCGLGILAIRRKKNA